MNFLLGATSDPLNAHHHSTRCIDHANAALADLLDAPPVARAPESKAQISSGRCFAVILNSAHQVDLWE